MSDDSSSAAPQDFPGAAGMPELPQPITAESAELDGDLLPPVEPPTAAFIVKLFVVPAVIVAGVIGVYLLFGQIAAGDLDWRELVTELKSDNPHVKWRGAAGLADAFDIDAKRGTDGQHLADNREIATALVELYKPLSQKSSFLEEEASQLEFLSKVIGRSDCWDISGPTLVEALDVARNEDVRKHAMESVIMIAGRAKLAHHPLNSSPLVDRVITLTQDQKSMFRNLGTAALGLLEGPDAESRLRVLLTDSDLKVQLNAAIGLVRSGSTDGLPVFESILKEATDWKLQSGQSKNQTEEDQLFERSLILKNALLGLKELADKLPNEVRERIIVALEKLEHADHEQAVHIQVRQLKLGLQSSAR